MNDLALKIWFYKLPITKPQKINVLSQGISLDEFYDFNLKNYIDLGIDILISQDIEKSKNLNIYTEVCEYIIKEKLKLIMYNDYTYPERLRNIYDPPVGIFVKGLIPDYADSLAIVGARRASEYGKTVAYKLSYELASRGITIISGMASGIDSCAHKGAINGSGCTIAVMGSGFKHIYPSSNRKLFSDICNTDKGGCAITEYMPDTPPLPFNFPERNRIISGLAKYVLVVEAGERSGSLITANLALEQGKDVFAVPGNIFSPNSIGTNKLIKEGAKLISCLDDILEEFNLNYTNTAIDKLDKYEAVIINLLKSGGATIECILQNTNLDSNDILAALSKLECRNIIRKAFGNYYILC